LSCRGRCPLHPHNQPFVYPPGSLPSCDHLVFSWRPSLFFSFPFDREFLGRAPSRWVPSIRLLPASTERSPHTPLLIARFFFSPPGFVSVTGFFRPRPLGEQIPFFSRPADASPPLVPIARHLRPSPGDVQGSLNWPSFSSVRSFAGTGTLTRFSRTAFSLASASPLRPPSHALSAGLALHVSYPQGP